MFSFPRRTVVFLRDEVPYLGHLISAHGIRPDPAKEKMFPTPCDVTTVYQFIGFTSYYRRFVPNFSNVASPLRALTKKYFRMDCGMSVCFRAYETDVNYCPYACLPQVWAGCRVYLGDRQPQPDGMLHPIAYASRSLDTSERNYGITELETLAVVWAARPYLLGHRTIVYTDTTV